MYFSGLKENMSISWHLKMTQQKFLDMPKDFIHITNNMLLSYNSNFLLLFMKNHIARYRSPNSVIPYQITKNFLSANGWHLRFYWNFNHRMPTWRKYYLENFCFILLMAQKLLHFKFSKIAFCHLQARFFQLWTQMTHQRKKQSDWNLDPLQPSTQEAILIISFH